MVIVDPTDAITLAATAPNWAEIVTGIGSALTGLGVIGVAISVMEARRDRHVLVLSELSRRWAGADLEEARTAMARHGSVGLQEKVEAWFAAGGVNPEVELLLRVPNFYEDLAILVESGGLKFDLVWRSFAGPAIGCWQYWEKAISAIQGRDAGAYVEYQNLVTKLKTRPMPKPVPRRAEQPSSEGDDASLGAGRERPSTGLQSSGSAAGLASGFNMGFLLRLLVGLVALSALGKIINRLFRSN